MTSHLKSLLVAAMLLCAFGAEAAELVMFERSGCPWCRKWNHEVGAVYALSQEGRRAPLRRASLDQPLPPELHLTPPVFYSPTFVLMHQGHEIGRITGYQGDELF